MIRRATLVSAAACLSLAGAAWSKNAPAPHLYGPEPSVAEYRRIAETMLRAQLYDPESARFRWRTTIYKGEYKPFLGPRVSGYIACGKLNAKNRVGGYTGEESFLVVIDYGRVLYSQSDDKPSGGAATNGCLTMIAKGLVQRLPDDEPTTGPTASAAVPATPSASPQANINTGLALRAMPEGAYVAGVVPGSPAAVAGLKPGMVIASVNSVPLAGMGEAMVKVVDAAGSSAILALVGGTVIKLGAAK